MIEELCSQHGRAFGTRVHRCPHMNFYLCRNSPSANSLVAVVLILFTWMTCKGDQSLFEFDNLENLKRVLSTGANVTETSRPKPMLKVTTGHVESWPGITLRAPA